MKKSDDKNFEEIIASMGREEASRKTLSPVEHNKLFAGITEDLLFSDKTYSRMDMSFLLKISSLDYGNRYRVALVDIRKDSTTEMQSYGKVVSELRDKKGIVLLTVWENLIIFIVPEKLISVSEMKSIYYALEKICKTVKMSVSTIKEKFEDCHAGFQEAIRTYDMIDTMKKYEENFLFYEDLGIWRLLYDLNEASIFEAYCDGVFKDLWSYDESNEGHLFETLECYFENNCDKVITAKKLYIHENTLRYRIHQIEEIMNVSLKDVNVIADIVTAIKIRRMVQILDNK